MTWPLRVVEAPPVIEIVLGIDPGPGAHGSAGFGLLDLYAPQGNKIIQCNADTAPWLLDVLLDTNRGRPMIIGIEGFAPGTGPGARKNGTAVSQQIDELAAMASRYGVPMTSRFASLVKGWATDKRLKAAGLYDLAPGSVHGRDGMRHAIFTAHHQCGWPDPLSRRFAAGRSAP